METGMEKTINLLVLSARHILDDVESSGPKVLLFSYYYNMAYSIYHAIGAAMGICHETNNDQSYDLLVSLHDELKKILQVQA